MSLDVVVRGLKCIYDSYNNYGGAAINSSPAVDITTNTDPMRAANLQRLSYSSYRPVLT